jgi:Holliday junction resolvase-like predicted endonuclease
MLKEEGKNDMIVIASQRVQIEFGSIDIIARRQQTLTTHKEKQVTY